VKVILYKDAENLLVPADNIFRLARLLSTLNVERKTTNRDLYQQQVTFDIGAIKATAGPNDKFLIISKTSAFYLQFKNEPGFFFLTPGWLNKIQEFEAKLVYGQKTDG
jgi:hypothetical protein